MAEKSKLELIGTEARLNHRIRNTFTGLNEEQKYSTTHTRAISDEETPEHGKGTGISLDTANGGSRTDINGDPALSGSGRKGNVRFNQYNRENEYQKPTIQGGLGEV